MNLTPLADNVVIEVLPRDEMTKGGIILPDTDKSFRDNFVYGIIRAVGPGRRVKSTGVRVEPQVAVGEKVLFNDHQALSVVQDEPRQVICQEENIFVRLEG